MQQTTTEPAQGRLWTTDFVLTLLVAHFLFTSFAGLYTVIPLFVVDRGGDVWHVGVVIGSMGVTGLAVRPFAGRWIQSFGPKRVAVLGSAVFGIATLAHMLAFNFWLIIPARMVQGMGLALTPVATATIVANLAPVHRRGEAMSVIGNAIATATMYSPVLGFWLFSRFGFGAAFAYTGVAALVGGGFALALSALRVRGQPSSGPTPKAPFFSKSALFPTAVFLCYTVTTAPVSTFLPILAEDRDLGNPGLYFTVMSLVSIFFMVGAGPAADRLGRAAVIVPGMLFVATGMFVLTGATNQIMLLSAAFLAGGGFGLVQPGIQSLTIDRAPTGERSSALATLQGAWDVGGFGGAIAFGPLAGVIGVAATFATAGAVALAGAAGFVTGIVKGSAPAAQTEDRAKR
ncbi:MAG: MFS transporter [SAR202 cluster bacterium]|nr:MFS transporter [SAR202 cluster bacterium]